MEDSQGLLPITATMPGGLEGVAAAIVASPNLPIIEFGEPQPLHCLYIVLIYLCVIVHLLVKHTHIMTVFLYRLIVLSVIIMCQEKFDIFICSSNLLSSLCTVIFIMSLMPLSK